jgi:hypothetical protein
MKPEELLAKIAMTLRRYSAMQLSAASAAACLAIFLVAATLANIFPQQFGGIFFGLLYHREGGVYADCRLRENRDNPICNREPPRTQNERQWSEMKRGGSDYQFSLSSGW